jgi:hypothetical protein
VPGSPVIPSFLASVDVDTHIQSLTTADSQPLATSYVNLRKPEYRWCRAFILHMACSETVKELLNLFHLRPQHSTA